MKHTKPKDWWREVKRFCGLSMGTPDNIFVNLEQDTQYPTVLSNLINDTFLEPMLNYPPLNDNVAVISENDTPIVVSVEEVLSHLQRIGSGKSSGPDNLPNWVLKSFADLLAEPVTVILNASFREERLPSVWKLANVCPIPKNKVVLHVNKDLRPISLTSSLCKIAEEIVISYDLKSSIMSCIDPNQYGFIPGSCTTLALISLIHRWTETVDARGGTVRALLTDYRKAFDLIDHNILCQKLKQIGIKPSVFNWIVDFLRARSQRVKLHSDCFSDWKPINAGVPQGTKLGPWLFLLMINDLSIPSDDFEGDMFKYADDTNVSEYIFNQEYTSSLQDVTNCIVNWSTYNKFELNPIKCKEIVINFQRNEPVFPPIEINGINVERVEKATILGLLITQDMKWNAHVDKITTKAAKRLYLMKQLKRSGLSDNDLKCFYIASIRSILEYACQVFHYGLPEYLSDQIERIQKRALRIICPDLSYSEAIEELDMETLKTRRKGLCTKVFKSIVNDKHHKIHHLLPTKHSNTYNLRNPNFFNIPRCNTNRFKNTYIISSLLDLV